MESNIMEIENICKSFENKEILKNCNLSLKANKIYGLLGVNGAGKTTLFKLITGLLVPDMGSIKIFGLDILKQRDKILKNIGSLIEIPIFYEHLSAIENLKIHLDYMGIDNADINSVLNTVGLQNINDMPVSKFSLGMRQRLGIARALIHKPKLLILDEPINGLDPIGIKEFRDIFIDIAHNQGITILISSHILSEIENIADTVGILSDGSISKQADILDIKHQNKNLEDYFFNRMEGND